MKIKKNKKNNMEYPRYKQMTPFLICAYMILSLLVNGIDNKSVLLTVMTVSMVVWFVGERIFPDNVYVEEKYSINKYIYISIGAFIFTVIVSEIFSKSYSNSVLVGEYESALNIFCYIILFFMAYRYGDIEKNQKMYECTILVLSVLTVIMSFVEFFDVPLAKVWLGSGINLSGNNRVVLSFGNSNYYGAFCCMLLTFITRLWLVSKDKVNKVLFVALNGALVCCIFMSKSTMAIYLMVFVVGGTIVYEYKRVLSQWKYILLFIAVLCIELLVINTFSSGKLSQLINVGVTNSDAFVEIGSEKYVIEDIKLDNNRLVIVSDDSELVIEYDKQLIFYDENNNILDVENEDNIIRFLAEPYSRIEVMVSFNRIEGMLLLEVDAGYKETIDFYIDNGVFKGVGADGKTVDDIGGKYTSNKMNGLFTGRGYIWINTISMLDNVILMGNGCGNFVNVFKQYDYVGLLKSQGTSNIIIDRPHNMFLQYCIDIGLIGTLAIFSMIILILICWIRQNIKYGRDEKVLSYSTFLSVIVFLGFSILNDSLIILSPYMWIFLGLNMSMQYSRNK